MFTRRCSIGIECPDIGQANTPLTAFLIYNHGHHGFAYSWSLPLPNHILSNRRVSIYDLHNFEDDCSLLQPNVTEGEESNENENNDDDDVESTVVQVMPESNQKDVRKHKRRLTSALRFEQPRVL